VSQTMAMMRFASRKLGLDVAAMDDAVARLPASVQRACYAGWMPGTTAEVLYRRAREVLVIYHSMRDEAALVQLFKRMADPECRTVPTSEIEDFMRWAYAVAARARECGDPDRGYGADALDPIEEMLR